MFFSFEGIDGSGKSTQARRLAERLRQQGRAVVEVREPGGTALGEQIRSLLLDPGSDVDDRAELLLFSAARAQLVASVIEPALERGDVVVADRFFDSSTAYQGGGRRVADPEWMAALHRFATAGQSPDRTYLIDVPPARAASRRLGVADDRIEARGQDFYARVREAYVRLTRDSRVTMLDGTQTPDAIHQQVWADAQAMLQRQSP